MKVHIKRIDNTLELPKYQTQGSAAVDLVARIETKIEPQQVGRIPANVIIEIPEGYFLLIAPRSSTPLKFGLSSPHGVGIIDSDYRGPEDEIQVQVFNFLKDAVIIKRGERIAQAIFVPYERAEWDELAEVRSKSRGGFGSTGH